MPTSNETADRQLLQERLASTCRILAIANAMFLLVNCSLLLSAGASLWQPLISCHALAIAWLGLVWAWTREGTPSVRLLNLADAIGFIGAGLGIIGMGFGIETMIHPEKTLVLILGTMCIARSIFVPSTYRRTLALGIAIGIPFVVGVYLIYRTGYDGSDYRSGSVQALADPANVGVSRAVTSGIWWTLITFLCCTVSKVIHGLRQTVRSIRKLGQYTLEGKLGQGSMGVVYRARHALLRRPTAIKLLPPDRVGEDSIAQFEREVRLTARLAHANTVTVFDYGRTPDQIFYYAMELLDGFTLQAIVERSGPMPPGRVVHVLRQVASALVEAHGLGLIHRDIKPANIMLCRHAGAVDVVKVLDFGLVKTLDTEETADTTGLHSIAGTPAYMAPEAFHSLERVDERTDIYGVGGVGYYLLTGTQVFTGTTLGKLCDQHLHARPDPPSWRRGEELPAALEELILQCLAKRPEDRPANAADLADQLAVLAGNEPWASWEPVSWWSEYARSMAASQSAVGPLDETVPASVVVDLQAHDIDPGSRSAPRP